MAEEDLEQSGLPVAPSAQLDLSLQLALKNKGVSQATLTVLTLFLSHCGLRLESLLCACCAVSTADSVRSHTLQVAVRCRPLLQAERENNVVPVTRVEDNKVTSFQEPPQLPAAGLTN